MSLLEMTGLTKDFGGLRALNNVTLAVQAGEIRGLIGPNGSGKTTLFNVVTGIFPPEEGQVTFKGERIMGWPPHKIAQAGLARTFQEIQLMYDMTVLENAMVGVHRLSKAGALAAVLALPWVRKEERFIREKARESLHFVGLEGYENELARNISYGHQRLLDIARCLASDPELLLLDEPSAGMNPAETRSMMSLIEKIRGRGTTVLLVEHNMKMVMNVCEVIFVLSYGVMIAEGQPAEIQANEQVVEAYLGRKTK